MAPRRNVIESDELNDLIDANDTGSVDAKESLGVELGFKRCE